MPESPLFEVGDVVRIRNEYCRSSSGRSYPGLITTVLRIEQLCGSIFYMLDMPDCGGVWLDELELAFDSEYVE